MKFIRFFITHVIALTLGVLLGLYLLPFLKAEEGPATSEVTALSQQSVYKAKFFKDMAGSNPIHWGEGDVFIRKTSVSLMGSLGPGPDYFLYFTKNLVDTRSSFLEIKADSLKVGPIRTFNNFIVPLDGSIDLEQYTAIVVWSEAFSQFITSASYRQF